MPLTTIKPNHKVIKDYYSERARLGELRVENEMGLRIAFQSLLNTTAKAHRWQLVPEESLPGKRIHPDGTLKDEFNIRRGYWEAKDTRDDLEKEIEAKIRKGYPTDNIIFEDSQTAVLYQDKSRAMEIGLDNPKALVDLLNRFYAYTQPDIAEFNQAVDEFKEHVPELARGLLQKITDGYKKNKEFTEAFDNFLGLCQTSLNPNISPAAVEEMLVQHLLTERLMRTIFDNPEFTKRNVIAAEVEKVIDALTGEYFNRRDFLKSLDRFYRAIENAARLQGDFTEKQRFLNSIYERFFQGYSVKVADTLGIVYTPQPIVDFMCASVAEVLEKEFGKRLGSPGVNIIDPCTGTGNFIVNLIRRISGRDLERMYKQQLFANEVMLMPYYIAALNIEHAYYEKTGKYEPFEGMCFVDTLDLAEEDIKKQKAHTDFFAQKNTERVERQRRTPITVVIGNPPYNTNQINENDNNKNRKYEVIDKRLEETYVKESRATLRNKLYDPYVKFIRWATDRLEGREGIVCFVTNNGFLRGIAFDGFRKHLIEDFQSIYHFDFKGNARTSGERRRQEGGNIFSDQIRVGIGITALVRSRNRKKARVLYHVVGDYWKAGEKSDYLRSFNCVSDVKWQLLVPDKHNNWLPAEHADEYAQYIPIGSKEAKAAKGKDAETVFRIHSLGIATNRDSHSYAYDLDVLRERAETFVEVYNEAVDKLKRKHGKITPESLVDVNDSRIKWTFRTKESLRKQQESEFDNSYLRKSLYRPFNSQFVYFDDFWIERRYLQHTFFPTPATEFENGLICVSGIGSSKPFHALVANIIPCLDLLEKTQCFPFYTYDKDGSNRRENITDWALKQFRQRYGGGVGDGLRPSRGRVTNPPLRQIGKWDIFYYVYGLLHHPGYRERYADNLKRELPRIPFAPDFFAFADAGRKLAELHLNYEEMDPYELTFIESEEEPLSYHVEKMRLSKDKTQLVVNPSLTLAGIPAETFEYRLGNRSALDWVIDQYRIKEDKRSGIVSDPNRDDDPEYIVRLVGQVIAVSLETVKIVKSLPEEFAEGLE